MDVALFAVVLLVLAAFVAQPLYRPPAPPESLEAGAARGRADAVAGALGDLDVDRASGLLDEQSYREERAALEGRAEGPSRSD